MVDNSLLSPKEPRPIDPLAMKVRAMKEAVLADTCFWDQRDPAACEWGEYPYEPAEFRMEQNTGEAILIVDDFSKLPPLTIRYKNRIMGYFRADEEGTLAPVSFSWRAPKTLFHALSTFATPQFIPAEKLRALSAPLEKNFGFYDAENIGHGSFVFSILVENNPHQPIVVLDHPRFSQFAPKEFCDVSGTEESIAKLRSKSERVAASLRQRMHELNVHFVNASIGETLTTMREHWEETCAEPLPDDALLRAKLEAYSPIMGALFNTPGVFTANAAIEASNATDYPFDALSRAYPNRLRVGYFADLDSGLDGQGQRALAAFSGTPQQQNVDVYLNIGVKQQRPYPYNATPLLQVSGFGMDIFPITRATTSWVTPLALSHFIHARYASFAHREMSNELIQDIKDHLVPESCPAQPENRCMYQDPLKHGQLEVVRLGYRKAEYKEPNPQG
jgi:hypothetical protein